MLTFSLGLAGSLHCVTMCGPIVLSWSLASGSRETAGHMLYHAGRITTYGILGAVAGAFGQAVSTLGAFVQFQNAAAITAGVLMLIAGLLLVGAVRRPSLVQIGPVSGLSRRAARLLSNPSSWSRLRLGLLMGFLPCGLVYAALLKAMSPASVWDGAVTMMAFGAGTAGPLLGLGLFSTVFSRRISQWGVPVTAVAVALMGMTLIVRGLMPVAMSVTDASHLHHH